MNIKLSRGVKVVKLLTQQGQNNNKLKLGGQSHKYVKLKLGLRRLNMKSCQSLGPK